MILSSEVDSLEQLGRIILELRDYVGQLRDRAVRKKVVGKKSEALPELSSLTHSLLRANDISPSSVEAIEQCLKELGALRKSAPVVHILLATTADKNIRQQLIEWFRAEVDPGIFISFGERSDIGGGFILRAGIYQYEYSFTTLLKVHQPRLKELLVHATA